jgi:putative transposase
MPIIAFIPDEERYLMRKEAQQTRDKNHARQLMAMLMLHQGMTVTEVAKILCAARSSVGRWINLFTLYGVNGLKSLKPGREPQWPIADILPILPLLVQRSPQDFGWLRSRCSTELLALVVNRIFNISLHPTTLYRYLKQAGLVWRRAGPTLKIKDPHYEEKRTVIEQALA